MGNTSNDELIVELSVVPTQNSIMSEFLSLLNESWLLNTREVVGRRNSKQTEFFVNMTLNELIAFRDNDYVKGAFKSKVLIKIAGAQLYYWECKIVLDGFATQKNGLYSDIKQTEAYEVLAPYLPEAFIPDWEDPNPRMTQIFQYASEDISKTTSSSFVVFNIRAGGGYHDSIKEIAIVEVIDGVEAVVEFREINNDLNQVWQQLEPYFSKGNFIVAFNLSVHKSNLEKSLEKYGIQLPKGKYLCVYNMAISALREVQRPILENVCHALRIPFEDSCLGKAKAAAEIVGKIESLKGKDISGYYNYLITNKLLYGKNHQ